MTDTLHAGSIHSTIFDVDIFTSVCSARSRRAFVRRAPVRRALVRRALVRPPSSCSSSTFGRGYRQCALHLPRVFALSIFAACLCASGIDWVLAMLGMCHADIPSSIRSAGSSLLDCSWAVPVLHRASLLSMQAAPWMFSCCALQGCLTCSFALMAMLFGWRLESAKSVCLSL